MARRPAKAEAHPDWDALVAHYNTADFIAADPISLPHRFYQAGAPWESVEFVAFLTALFSYGQRKTIIPTMERLLKPLGDDPLTTLATWNARILKHETRGFYYRFNTQQDTVFLLARLNAIYRDYGSLRAFWQAVTDNGNGLDTRIAQFRRAFLSGACQVPAPDSHGMRFLMADPEQGSAAKRFTMFLRWMVRQDAVDFGFWGTVLRPAQLVMPLDTHVASVARRFGITHRKSNDWKTTVEITRFFARLNPDDPVRYDFALFGLGVDPAT